jgi:hypothetical protein
MPQSTRSAGLVDAAERRSATSSWKHLHAQPVPCVPVRAFLIFEACLCRRCRARPVPCTLLYICMHYAATGRLGHARITLHAYECARELQTCAQPDLFAVAGVRCAHAHITITNKPRVYDDTSHVRMTQQAIQRA